MRTLIGILYILGFSFGVSWTFYYIFHNLILYFYKDYKNYKIMRNISIFYWIILIVMKILHLF